ncbi:hypothetical protein RB597_005206 [Gaeumannomyces tritici]
MPFPLRPGKVRTKIVLGWVGGWPAHGPTTAPRHAFFSSGPGRWKARPRDNDTHGEGLNNTRAKRSQMAHLHHSRSASSSPPGGPDPPSDTTPSEPPYYEVERNPHHQRGLAGAKLLSRRAALSARDAADEAHPLAGPLLAAESLVHRPKSRHVPGVAQMPGSFNLDLSADDPIWAELGVPCPGSEDSSDTTVDGDTPPDPSGSIVTLLKEVITTADELAQLAISHLDDIHNDDPDPTYQKTPRYIMQNGVRLYITHDGVTLNREQSRLVELVLGGRNVFYTGPAGCGKSAVLKTFVRELEIRHKIVDIVAPTGIAALNVGGTTTWSYMGWKPDDDRKPLDELKEITGSDNYARERLQGTEVLVIDEISMLDSNFFYRMSEVMKSVRESSDPFGGVQVVVTGDFLQLPPVKPFKYCMECGRDLLWHKKHDVLTCPNDSDDSDDSSPPSNQPRCPNPRAYSRADKWAFRSTTWAECDFSCVQLKNVHRQSDPGFLSLLAKCRLGSPMSQEEVELLKRNTSCAENAVKLSCTNKEVDAINKREYDRLDTEQFMYRCVDDIVGLNPKSRRHQRLLHLERKEVKAEDLEHETLYEFREHRYDKKLFLREGMRVCLLANLDIDAGLVNGSQGVICGFEIITGESTGAKRRESKIDRFIEGLEKEWWPVVEFENKIKGEPKLRRTIVADRTIIERGPHSRPSEVLLSRTQIPLMPAWAMTVHKAQGMTLENVIVNMDRVFEEGQLYVALSRARSLGGLVVEGNSEALSTGAFANKQARQFYEREFGIGSGE